MIGAMAQGLRRLWALELRGWHIWRIMWRIGDYENLPEWTEAYSAKEGGDATSS